MSRERAISNFLRLGMIAAAVHLGWAAPAEDTLRWHPTIEEASMEAIPANRPLMIDFQADWCAPCKAMEKEVYSTDEFRKATREWSLVKIDFDRHPELARKYNVDTLPAIIFADSRGTLLFHHQGYLGPAPLLALTHALPSDVSEFNRLDLILAADKNNLGALESMGKALRSAGLFRTSADYYVRAADRPDAKANPQRRETILNEIGLNYLDVSDVKLAAGIFEKCLKQFPGSARRAEWSLNLGRAYSLGDKKDKEKAKKVLQTLIQSDPTSTESKVAQKTLDSL